MNEEQWEPGTLDTIVTEQFGTLDQLEHDLYQYDQEDIEEDMSREREKSVAYVKRTGEWEQMFSDGWERYVDVVRDKLGEDQSGVLLSGALKLVFNDDTDVVIIAPGEWSEAKFTVERGG